MGLSVSQKQNPFIWTYATDLWNYLTTAPDILHGLILLLNCQPNANSRMPAAQQLPHPVQTSLSTFCTTIFGHPSLHSLEKIYDTVVTQVAFVYKTFKNLSLSGTGHIKKLLHCN